jgi:hypothetical protein
MRFRPLSDQVVLLTGATRVSVLRAPKSCQRRVRD